MNRFKIATAAAAILAASSVTVFAAEATGAIQAIDPAARTVTLDDGNTYLLPAAVNAARLMVGQKVTITYEQQDGKMNASDVKPAA